MVTREVQPGTDFDDAPRRIFFFAVHINADNEFEANEWTTGTNASTAMRVTFREKVFMTATSLQ